MTITNCNWEELDGPARTRLLRRPAVADDRDIRAQTHRIVDEVRQSGDDALLHLTRQYDGADLTSLAVGAEEIRRAEDELSAAQLEAIDMAIANVRRFHEAQRAAPIRVETMPGVVCERISHAIDAVGLYVPAGTAPLPSAAIMLAVPAAIAGCPLRILCTPPRPDGSADPAVLVAATRAGVSDIYKVGGAQAIAAMAYGTESIPRVGKIFGPGNAWVTCAKSLVSADPEGAAIDMPAGPSEVLVIADAQASPEFVAADLLAQAEHDVLAQAVLVTPRREVAEAVAALREGRLIELTPATACGGHGHGQVAADGGEKGL